MNSVKVLLITLLILIYNGQTSAEAPISKVMSEFFTFSNQNYLVMTFQTQPGWHTYWKNPGIAGMGPVFKFYKNNTVLDLEELPWPQPKVFKSEGALFSYGYEGEYSFFFRYPNDLENVPIRVHIKWLACRDVCIPEEQTINLTYKSNINTSNTELVKRLHELPREQSGTPPLKIRMEKNSDGYLYLKYNFDSKHFTNHNPDRNVLYPFPNDYFSFGPEILTHEKNSTFGKILLTWEGEYRTPEELLPVNGIFDRPLTLSFLLSSSQDDKHPMIIHQRFDRFSMTSDAPEKDTGKTVARPTEHNFLLILLFAFLGGLILNVMPCVLPVLSLKLFSLLKQKGQTRKELLKHNFFYISGILFSFLILAIAVIIIKNAGHEIGWGFHLQSPSFVSLTTIIMYLFALNLFGLFELRIPASGFFSKIKINETASGEFLGGIIATVLSTPCSAPFLASALAFAFTSNSSLLIILLFVTIALGLASPFIITSLFPSTLRILPKPGAWMLWFKKIMGIALIATVIWLLSVYHYLNLGKNSEILLYLTLAFTLLFLLIGLKKKHEVSLIILKKILIIMTFLSIGMNLYSHDNPIANKSSAKDEIHFELWAPEKMNDFSQTTFIDFTAKWCLTCKMNKLLVMDREEFRDYMKQKNIRLLRADWTNEDPVIGHWLKEHGKAAVPAYFIQHKNGDIVSLGEILSMKEIRSATSSER